MLVFAGISPHPPIILPNVGLPKDRQQVKKTITSLKSLAPKLLATKPDIIIISSPHPDWGINVPLHFLTRNLQFSIFPSFIRTSNLQSISNDLILNFKKLGLIKNHQLKIKNSAAVFPILTSLNSPAYHYKLGQQIAAMIPQKLRWAWIASGDMSHVLKENGPYGFHPSGPKFDHEFIDKLQEKDIKGILNMNSQLIDEAEVCGLWSFSMLFGALDNCGISWQPEILSYEGPFGVGYLVTNTIFNPHVRIS